MLNVEIARRQMIEQQVRAWEVFDPRVLDAIASVPREAFVPDGWRGLAFADTEIPLGYGEVMMTPKVEGRLLQALELRDADSALEIGTGSGFLAACLHKLARAVTSIDIRSEFTERAARRLRDNGAGSVLVDVADAFELDCARRFDAIAVTGSLPVHDERFQRRLEVGGRLFMIVGTPPVMEALRVRRASETEWTRESLFETAIPPLSNAPPPPAFVF